MNWTTHEQPGWWHLPYEEGKGRDLDLGRTFIYSARIQKRGLKFSLELWRKNGDNWGWEFVERFETLGEAKRVGYTLVRIEN